MNIINKENIITNKQIIRILNILPSDYHPNNVIIANDKLDYLKYCFSSKSNLMSFQWNSLFNKIESEYNKLNDSIIILTYALNEYKDLHSKQLYLIGDLVREARSKYMLRNINIPKITLDVKEMESKISQLSNNIDNLMNNHPNLSEDLDEFAKKFVDDYSEEISQIMDWEDEWEIEEF